MSTGRWVSGTTVMQASDADQWDGDSSKYLFNLEKHYGCVMDGTTDNTTRVNAAAADIVSNGGGILYHPGGDCLVTDMPNFTVPTHGSPLPYAIQGIGAALAGFSVVGTSDSATLTVSDPTFDYNNPSDGAPWWGGFTLDGAGSSGGCSGLSWSDVSYPVFHDLYIKGFTTGDGFRFPNTYGWTEGVQMDDWCKSRNNLNLIKRGTGLGALQGTITTTLTNGSSYTTIAVSGGIAAALYSGQPFIISSGSGTLTQTVKTTSSYSVGATSIAVQSFTAAQTYTAGTAKAYSGGFPSFDYWNINSLNLNGQANQNGWVEDVPLGQTQQIVNVGSKIRVVGNFQTGSSNSGKAMWLKGGSYFDKSVVWEWAVEADGSTTPHLSVQMDNSGAFLTGAGMMLFSEMAAGSYAGGIYQFEPYGLVNLTGLTTASPNNSPIDMRGSNRLNAYSPKPTWAPTVTSGTAFQNTRYDTNIVLLVELDFTTTGTVSSNVDGSSGLSAGAVTETTASGQKKVVRLPVPARNYARVDWTGTATVANTQVEGIF